jgi:hypothetical protein
VVAALPVVTLMEELLCDEVGRISNADIHAIYPFSSVPIFLGLNTGHMAQLLGRS